MFRALLCSSSGGQIVLVQHLVSSLSLGDCSVHKLRELCTERSAKESEDALSTEYKRNVIFQKENGAHY